MPFPKRSVLLCCFALVAVQALVYSTYILRLFPLKRSSEEDGDTLVYFVGSDIELYTNDVLNLTELQDDTECAVQFLDTYSRYCEKAIVPSSEVVRQYAGSGTGWSRKELCPCLPQNLTGTVNLNMSSLKLSAQIFNGLLPGGHWSPSWCIPRQRIAIIVPFRDRAAHLDLFLQVYHPFLQSQFHSYSIFVIEQQEPEIFNKAALMNVGFVEIIRRTDRVFDCFIFHDVDSLPEDDRNMYGCYRVPRHVAAFYDKLGYRLKYYKMFGGATAFTRRQFELSNGYSNEFWGWGGEDDDMEKRIAAANFSFMRFPKCVARYTMIKHDQDKGNPSNNQAALGWYYRPEVYKRDGLNTLRYALIGYEERLLYTKMVVSLPSPSTAATNTSTSTTTKSSASPMPSSNRSSS